MRRARTGVLVIALFLLVSWVTWRSGAQVPKDGLTGALSAATMGSASSSDWAISAEERNFDSMSVKALTEGVGATGEGRTLAIVDTGVDVAVPGFRDAAGLLRVRTWLDLTSEGATTVTGPIRSENGRLVTDEVTLDISALRSLSGTFYIGVVPPKIGAVAGAESAYFVVFDSFARGSFESVCIDVNGDSSFAGETVLRPFSESGSFTQIPVSRDKSLTVVLATVNIDSGTAVFGADLNGHGTMLAALAAGGGPGEFRGVAPGASLMAIKVLAGDGKGAWRDVAVGVETAIREGADVVLVGSTPDDPADDSQWLRVERLAEENGVPIILPAGNMGPGAATITIAKSAPATIVAGGFVPGEDGTVDAWYPLSSAGPDRNGNLGVDVLGPAKASAPMAGYHTRVQFGDVEGTSVAAAYVAGGAVLLEDAAEVRSGSPDGLRICLALREGASHVPGALPVEEGFGMVDLGLAWDLFRQGIQPAGFQLARKWDGSVTRGGLFLSGTSLGAAPLWIDNYGAESVTVDLSTSASWLWPQATYINADAASQRMTWLYGEPQIGPGLYSAQLLADDPYTPGVDGRMPVTAIVPHVLDRETPGSSRIRFGMPRTNRVSRQFFEVPESAEAMKITLYLEGRGIFTLYNPDGQAAYRSATSKTSSIDVGLPRPGLWQLTLMPDLTQATKGDSAAGVEIAFLGVVVSSDGISQGAERYRIIHDPTESVKSSSVRDTPSSVWRYRRSGLLQVQSTTTLSYPLVSDGTLALSLRLGTVTGPTLKGYLYQFSQDSHRWIEVASCSTDDGSAGSIFYPTPRAGKYVAYIEAYGSGTAVYGEIDALLVPALTTAEFAASERGSSEPVSGSGRRPIQEALSVPVADVNSSRYIFIESKTKPRLAGIIERPEGQNSETPLVQVMGSALPGPGIRTVRVSTPDGRYGLDLVITVGTTSYQTNGGRVTGIIDSSLPVYHMTPARDEFVVDAP